MRYLTVFLIFINFYGFSQLNDSVTKRYLLYRNEEKNNLLYRSLKEEDFFYCLEQLIQRSGELWTFPKTQHEELKKLAGVHSLLQIPGVDYLLHNPDIPLTNIYGEDSLVYFDDGTIEYVYPDPDTLFYKNKSYDALLIEERLTSDSTGKQFYKPECIFLVSNIGPENTPVVTFKVWFEQLYHCYIFSQEELHADKFSTELIKQTEVYLQKAIADLGGIGNNTINPQWDLWFLRNTYNPLDSASLKRDSVINSFRNLPGITVLKQNIEICKDTYDETLLDYRTENCWTDTVYNFIATSGFERILVNWKMSYSEAGKVWEQQATSLTFQRNLIANEAITVYEVNNNENVLHPVEYVKISQVSDVQYDLKNNPARKYLNSLKPYSCPLLDWEKALYNHSLNAREVKLNGAFIESK